MKKGKYMKAPRKTAPLALILVLALLVGGTIGGTVAWLIDTTEQVTNTFTVGDINIELSESTGDEYKIVPDTEQPKDPKVTVKGGSENCYVFVQVKEENNTTGVKKYVTWNNDSAWMELNTTGNVTTYYMVYTTSATDLDIPVLAGNKVSYSEDLTKGDLENIGGNTPKLTFKAFAVQKEAGDSALEAWNQVAAGEKLVPTP